MPNVWHVFSFYNSTFANGEVKGVKEVREFKEVKEVRDVKDICFIAKYTTKKRVCHKSVTHPFFVFFCIF